MAEFPPAVRRLVAVLKELPAVGTRSAERMVVYLLQNRPELAGDLAHALTDLRAQIRPCQLCGFFAEENLCEICRDPKRDQNTLCVVESAADVVAVEKSGAYGGRYHVLGGTLSPLDGVGPEDLELPKLIERLQAEPQTIREVILALGSDVRGETTSLLLSEQLTSLPVTISRPAAGISIGSSLEYADTPTLNHAFSHRHPLHPDYPNEN